jgi:Tfp pilus assembly protein PilF
MQPILKRLAALCAGSLLLACASPIARAPAAASLALDAEQAYLIGRSYHMAMRPQQAIGYYRSALRDAPGHLNARNGLAVLYAEQGDLKPAIALWQELTASAAGRNQAFLFSNLGYAHLLQGEPARALAVLEQACLLDPLSERAWQHLGDALAMTGQQARAATMHKQAASLRGHDLRSDLAATAATAPSAQPAPQWAQTEVSQRADGMLVLRRIEPGQRMPVAAPVPVAVEEVAPPAAAARPLLEISNGNGVTGMARKVAGELGQGGPQVVRLTNQKGFGVKLTRVEYQPEFRAAAERLAERLGTAKVVAASQRGRTDLRLVLGRDMAKTARTAVAATHKAPMQPG